MNIKALIIHLHRATDRRKQVDRLLQQSPVPAEVLDAVDGTMLAGESVNSVYKPSLHAPRYPFQLRIAEIACFLSHRKCWQTIVDQNLDAALILEDDVELDNTEFKPAYDLAILNCKPADYIRFPMKRREVPSETRAASSTHAFFTPKVTGLGMQGQLVGKNAARTLLEKTLVFDRPVDTFLQMTWLTGVWPTCVCPSGISELSAQLGGSSIGKKKSWKESLRREILRPLYRRRLATLASSATPHNE